MFCCETYYVKILEILSTETQYKKNKKKNIRNVLYKIKKNYSFTTKCCETYSLTVLGIVGVPKLTKKKKENVSLNK